LKLQRLANFISYSTLSLNIKLSAHKPIPIISTASNDAKRVLIRKSYTDNDLIDVMKKICDVVEQEGLADSHVTLTRLLQQRLVLQLHY